MGCEQELADAVMELVQPSRIDIVRAKRLILHELADGQPDSTWKLLGAVAAMLEAEPFTPRTGGPTRPDLHFERWSRRSSRSGRTA
jgi:hypothetical protein